LSSFRIFETDEFRKKLNKLSLRNRKLITSKLKDYAYPQLKEDPFFGANIKKLKEYDPETWRYRIGDFRIFYVIDAAEKVVYILTIDARKDAYKRKG
jgi:mRNA interferase RelE/StbE